MSVLFVQSLFHISLCTFISFTVLMSMSFQSSPYVLIGEKNVQDESTISLGLFVVVLRLAQLATSVVVIKSIISGLNIFGFLAIFCLLFSNGGNLRAFNLCGLNVRFRFLLHLAGFFTAEPAGHDCRDYYADPGKDMPAPVK